MDDAQALHPPAERPANSVARLSARSWLAVRTAAQERPEDLLPADHSRMRECFSAGNHSRVSECFSVLADRLTTPGCGSGTTPGCGSANVHVLTRHPAARLPVEGAKSRSPLRRVQCAERVGRLPGEGGRQPAASESRKPRLPDASKRTGTSGADHQATHYRPQPHGPAVGARPADPPRRDPKGERSW